jgi:glyoxylase-like metal-dependent hydrolase (beta-lactamase superfamily II)
MIKESAGKISDKLYAIGNPALPAFLIPGKVPALFDAGMTFMGPYYLKELKSYMEDPGRLQYLLLTHSHYDHCGSAPFLKKKIPGLNIGGSRLAAEVWKRPNAIRLIQSLSGDHEERFKWLIGDEDVSFHTLEIDLILEDGSELILGDGIRVRVIATPGHTRDAVSFYLPEWEVLIAGEAVGVYDRNFEIRPEFLSSYEDYIASLEKLAPLDINLLLMAHSYVLTEDDARRYVPKSIEATKRCKKKIEDLLDSLGGDQEAVVKKIFEEEYVDSNTAQQEQRPYLLNLQSKVKAVAERK